MPIRTHVDNRWLARAAMAAGLAIGSATGIVEAAPSVDPAPPVDVPASSEGDSALDSTKTALSDTAVTSKVKAELLTSQSLKGSSISVTTSDGVVQLSGRVRSAEQKTIAEQLVQEIHGVKGVDASRVVVASTR